jgi:hypothetical protein
MRFRFALAGAALVAAGCGSTDGQAPMRMQIVDMNARSGNNSALSAQLDSDVFPLVADFGEAELALIARDQSGQTSPSDLNSVTINRYRVVYRRSDGHNIPGVDVPYPFDSAVTVTVPIQGTATAAFQLVRITAKDEAPLRALVKSSEVIHTIAEVTFYGKDVSGKDVSVTGSIGITFADFATTQN